MLGKYKQWMWINYKSIIKFLNLDTGTIYEPILEEFQRRKYYATGIKLPRAP